MFIIVLYLCTNAVLIVYSFCIVPPFNVTIYQSYYDSLYAGTNLTIFCDITLSSLVNIPIKVSNEWTRNGSQITEDTIREDLSKIISNLTYTASLEFYPLNDLTDDGEYRCTVRVSSDEMDENSYTTNITNNASTSLDVLGKLGMGLLYQQL